MYYVLRNGNLLTQIYGKNLVFELETARAGRMKMYHRERNTITNRRSSGWDNGTVIHHKTSHDFMWINVQIISSKHWNEYDVKIDAFLLFMHQCSKFEMKSSWEQVNGRQF